MVPRRRLLGGAAAVAAGGAAGVTAGGAAGVTAGGAAGVTAGGAAAAPALDDLPPRPFRATVPHLIEAEQLVEYVTLLTPTATNNVYKAPGEENVLTWGAPGQPETWFAKAQCASFLTGVLARTYPWATEDYFRQYFGHASPFARDLVATFAAATELPHLQRVTRVADLRPGDLLAIDYRNGQDTNTGHAVMVRELVGSYDRKLTLPGTVQYAVQIADCTSDPHGEFGLGDYAAYPDTRLREGVAQQGVGYGHLMLYADASTGLFAAYRWSVNTGSAKRYTVAQRPIAAARPV